MTNTIIIPTEERDIIQRADIECSARMNLISFIMRSNDMDLDNQRFKDYQNEYTEYFLAFEKVKRDLENKYLAGKTYSSWSLDYASSVLTYES